MQVEQGAGELMLCVDRHSLDDVRKRDTPQDRGEQAPGEGHPVPTVRPRLVVLLMAKLERHAAQDQPDEDEEERDVEPAEECRVPERKGSERRSAGEDEPHLIAVPHRADAADHHASLDVVATDERQQHADAEVEALEEEVIDPEQCDDAEPEDLQAVGGWHQRTPSTPSPRADCHRYHRPAAWTRT